MMLNGIETVDVSKAVRRLKSLLVGTEVCKQRCLYLGFCYLLSLDILKIFKHKTMIHLNWTHLIEIVMCLSAFYLKDLCLFN